MNKWILCAALLLLAFAGQAQGYTDKASTNAKALNFYERGVKYARNGEADKAMKDIRRALDEDPLFVDAWLYLGGLHYNDKAYGEAEAAFEKGLALHPGHDARALYNLAFLKQRLRKYAEAAEAYAQYIAHPDAKGELLAKAQANVRNCSFAASAVANPVPFAPQSLGTKVNTPEQEYQPYLSADEQWLIYTTRSGGQEDIFYSRKVGGEWQAGLPIGPPINTEAFNEGTQCLSADGKNILFTRCGAGDGYGSCDIYLSERLNGTWQRPYNLGPRINSRAWESQPSLSADGSLLFFASNRDGGQGGRDLYVARRQPRGQWGAPQNLGPAINTPGDEQSPFIHPDGQTLYFMSDGLPGMGGADLYVSRLQPDGTWGAPENLGYPINTEDNEGGIRIGIDGRTAYFDSNKLSALSAEDELRGATESRRSYDLFSFELPEAVRPRPVTYVRAIVSDAESGQPLPAADVLIVDVATLRQQAYVSTDAEGEFLLCLPLGADYGLSVDKRGFLFHSENFALAGKSFDAANPYLLEIKLQRVPLGLRPADAGYTESANNLMKAEPIVLRNIFFESGSAALRPESTPELERLRQLLGIYPTMRIEIQGHTDDVGNDADNLRLSEARARAVADWLQGQGIAAARLLHRGFGETQPIAPNNTPEGRQMNRRTAFLVLE